MMLAKSSCIHLTWPSRFSSCEFWIRPAKITIPGASSPFATSTVRYLSEREDLHKHMFSKGAVSL